MIFEDEVLPPLFFAPSRPVTKYYKLRMYQGVIGRERDFPLFNDLYDLHLSTRSSLINIIIQNWVIFSGIVFKEPK